MVLGLGGIFAVRIYTTSQVLLFRYIEMPLEVINLGTLILGGALIVWSLLPRRSRRVCNFTAPLRFRNLAQGKSDRHKSMRVESKA